MNSKSSWKTNFAFHKYLVHELVSPGKCRLLNKVCYLRSCIIKLNKKVQLLCFFHFLVAYSPHEMCFIIVKPHMSVSR